VFNASGHGTILRCPGATPGFREHLKGRSVAAQNKLPGTDVRGGAGSRQTQAVDMKGHLAVSELISDRAAAPSPFGDDQTFPLPVDRLTYIPSTPA
jgi:hypothetical protein